jgi:hypothetical protein
MVQGALAAVVGVSGPARKARRGRIEFEAKSRSKRQILLSDAITTLNQLSGLPLERLGLERGHGTARENPFSPLLDSVTRLESAHAQGCPQRPTGFAGSLVNL